jgi:hypothetical protein
MKATEAKLLDFLKKSPQLVIPIYQRTYSWTEKECRQLWDDIVRSGSDERIAVHCAHYEMLIAFRVRIGRVKRLLLS